MFMLMKLAYYSRGRRETRLPFLGCWRDGKSVEASVVPLSSPPPAPVVPGRPSPGDGASWKLSVCPGRKSRRGLQHKEDDAGELCVQGLAISSGCWMARQ